MTRGWVRSHITNRIPSGFDRTNPKALLKAGMSSVVRGYFENKACGVNGMTPGLKKETWNKDFMR